MRLDFPTALAPAVRRGITDLDPELAPATMNTMDDLSARSIATQRFVMILLFTFGGVGLALALVGVYGVIAQLSRRRSREIGIRLALGAKRGAVEWLVVLQGLRLTGLGLLVGLALTLVATRAMRSLLFGVGAQDPMTFAVVGGGLFLVALLASLLPARRATLVDPMDALRAE